MKKETLFPITYSRIEFTDDSEDSEDYIEDNGWINEEGIGLRDLIYDYRGCHIEPDSSPVNSNSLFRWLTVYIENECYGKGSYQSESHGIHFPEKVTAASRRRIYKLLTKRN